MERELRLCSLSQNTVYRGSRGTAQLGEVHYSILQSLRVQHLLLIDLASPHVCIAAHVLTVWVLEACLPYMHAPWDNKVRLSVRSASVFSSMCIKVPSRPLALRHSGSWDMGETLLHVIGLCMMQWYPGWIMWGCSHKCTR